MAADEVFQVKLHQTWGAAGKPLLNVFYYRQLDGSLGAAELLNLCDFYLTPKLAQVQNPIIKYTTWEVFNLDDLGDYAIDTVNTPAGTAGVSQALPSFVCYSFRFARTTRAVRNGQKRIAGVGEEYQSGGVVNDNGMLTALGELAAIMNTTLVDAGNGSHWSPRIFRHAGLNSKGQPVARADFPVGSVQYVRISTQNTRKE